MPGPGTPFAFGGMPGQPFNLASFFGQLRGGPVPPPAPTVSTPGSGPQLLYLRERHLISLIEEDLRAHPPIIDGNPTPPLEEADPAFNDPSLSADAQMSLLVSRTQRLSQLVNAYLTPATAREVLASILSFCLLCNRI